MFFEIFARDLQNSAFMEPAIEQVVISSAFHGLGENSLSRFQIARVGICQTKYSYRYFNVNHLPNVTNL